MRSRRALRLVVLTAVVGYLIVVPAVALTQYARAGPEVMAQATAHRDALAAEAADRRAACLASPPRAPAGTAAEQCPPAPAAEELGPVEGFLTKQPFLPSQAYGPVLTALLLISAITCYAMGAHWVGSDLSARTMTTLLTWEPRRTRVFAVRAGLFAGATAAAGVVVTSLWTATAAAMTALLGRNDLSGQQWLSTALNGGRGVLLMLTLGLLGVGAGFLARGTAGALAGVFLELVVLELFVRNVFPPWQMWLPGVNAIALMRSNGVVVAYPQEWVDADGNVRDTVHVLVSSGQGAAVLVAVTAAVLALAWVTWSRRDVA